MLLGSQDDSSRADATAFFMAWTHSLPTRFEWFCEQAARVGIDADLSTASLEPLMAFVHAESTNPFPVAPPLWFSERAGLSRLGAALLDGLMAYVAEIYARFHGSQLPWTLATDPRDAYFHRPVIDLPAFPPPWRQVFNCLHDAREGDVARLRRAVEFTLAHAAEERASRQPRADLPPVAQGSDDDWLFDGPLVELLPIGPGGWCISFPENIEDVLGDRYDDLEDALLGVDGVVAGFMEDRDRALLTTRTTLAEQELLSRVTDAVLALRDDGPNEV